LKPQIRTKVLITTCW